MYHLLNVRQVILDPCETPKAVVRPYMTHLIQAHDQWAIRPNDERFLSLDEMLTHMTTVREESASKITSSRHLTALPDADNKGMQIQIDSDVFTPTHWSFGQVCQRANAPAGYLRNLPSPIASDCINYGLLFREVDEMGVLLRSNGENTLRAATGPNYGRIWNSDVVQALVNRFGNGTDGQWKVPGEFGKPVPITKQNTTLFASDRDMFVFLCDETNRIQGS
jgi:hypothetical protein